MPVLLSLPPAVVIHGIGHARAALRPGRPVLLLSAPAAAAFAGAGWWRAMMDLAMQDAVPQPDALDCGDEPGRALEALAMGCRIVVLIPCPAFAEVMERAAGARVLTVRPAALDMASRRAPRQLETWLQGDSDAAIG